MLRVYADQYIALGERIGGAKAVYALTEPDLDDPARDPMSPESCDGIAADLAQIQRLCNELDLPVAFKLVKKHREPIPTTLREYGFLVDVVYAELEGRLFLYVPANVAKFYDDDDILSEAARLAFPSCHKELRDSGSSLACGLWTASVFHAMRAAEIGVRALGKALNVTFPDKPLELAEWHQILDQADRKIKDIGQQPKTTQRDEDLLFYSTAAAQFRYFKDGWRVRVAHGRETYDEAQAVRLLDHARDFFETLAGRLSE